jgi:hypothetical protein
MKLSIQVTGPGGSMASSWLFAAPGDDDFFAPMADSLPDEANLVGEAASLVPRLWGLLNLLGGLLLLRPDAHRSPRNWDDDLTAFEGGVPLAAWMITTELVLRTNTAP